MVVVAAKHKVTMLPIKVLHGTTTVPNGQISRLPAFYIMLQAGPPCTYSPKKQTLLNLKVELSAD